VSTSLSVSGTTVEALTLTLDPIAITSNEEGMTLGTGLHIQAINTNVAAVSLAESVNPILSSSNPQASKLTVGNLVFKTSDGQVLGWSKRLLHEQSVPVPLTPICVACALAPSDSANQTPAKQPAAISATDIKLAQLSTDSGFSLSTKLSHAQLPLSMSLALGYIGFHVDLAHKPFISFDVPGGLSVKSDAGVVDLQTRLVVARDETVAERVESLVAAVIGGSGSTTIGLTDFVIGNSEQQKVVTFSKIVVEVDSETVRNVVAKMPSGSGGPAKTLAKLTGAEVDVKSANQVRLGAKATVLDVPGLSISLGSLSLVMLYCLPNFVNKTNTNVGRPS
jgi:hypothetical protein